MSRAATVSNIPVYTKPRDASDDNAPINQTFITDTLRAGGASWGIYHKHNPQELICIGSDPLWAARLSLLLNKSRHGRQGWNIPEFRKQLDLAVGELGIEEVLTAFLEILLPKLEDRQTKRLLESLDESVVVDFITCGKDPLEWATEYFGDPASGDAYIVSLLRR